MPKITLRHSPRPAGFGRVQCIPTAAPAALSSAPVVLDLPAAARLTAESAARLASGRLPLHFVNSGNL